MLRKVRKALLITDVSAFAESFGEVAAEAGVELQVEASWNPRWRVDADVVALGSKRLPELNEAYYPSAVVILREGESPAPYMAMGVERFVFDHKSPMELALSLYKAEPVVLRSSDVDYERLVGLSPSSRWRFGDYDFDFGNNRFLYKGSGIYLSPSSKRYLAEWLLNGSKDNSRRMVLCLLRKKLGDGFLRDVDRFGRLEGGKE